MNQKLVTLPTPPTDLRAIRSREAMRSALLKLLEEKPLEQIVVRDITSAAGVGYATFYRHYPTRDALLDDVARELVAQLVNLSLPIMDAENTFAACMALCTYVDEHRSLWVTLLTGGAAAVIKQELLRVSRQVAATRSDPDSWLPVELGVVLAVSSQIELMVWWLSQPDPLPIEQAARILDRVIITPTITAEWRTPAVDG